MSPARMFNRTSGQADSSLYYVYTSDQPSIIRLQDGSELRMQPSEFFILDADRPLEWILPSDYTTQSLLIEKKFFHAHVARENYLVGKRLKFAFGAENCLADMLNVAWGMTRAGIFERSGAKLVLFNSSGYFSTEFHRVYGMSPRRYRAMHLSEDRYSRDAACVAATYPNVIAGPMVHPPAR